MRFEIEERGYEQADEVEWKQLESVESQDEQIECHVDGLRWVRFERNEYQVLQIELNEGERFDGSGWYDDDDELS